MLRANVGLSRKVSRDFQSTGYSINLDGEILFSVDDPEAVLGKVQELFGLAQEALDREVDRDQSESAIGRRDEERQPLPPPEAPPRLPPSAVSSSKANHSSAASSTREAAPQASRTTDEPATNKQIQFILNMGKRFKLSMLQLEARVGDIVGRKCTVYELTKKEAGRVLNQLTHSQPVSQSA
ncbi:hypothetical protein Psta_4445 [Pirellula staleyi DSM 6068]|uniref:Uncharacterized protein n=1 Tax=Pirellula staleyi (strain ATCC 27377 / DSM 6068 / ICPB 4128) TaxID=530564 RepID=D2R605_PIRSD|nr:hypothetical protein [Pirellula staleyi]ADB19090.1 hypothetical protein Psta_4445 [Pirellula staleyi DSM 6068]